MLVTHPAVAEAQVVGIPDSRLGEIPAAFIKRRAASPWDEHEIIAFCKHHLAPFKVPRFIREIDEWPMSATKIRKVDLRTRMADELRVERSA